MKHESWAPKTVKEVRCYSWGRELVDVPVPPYPEADPPPSLWGQAFKHIMDETETGELSKMYTSWNLHEQTTSQEPPPAEQSPETSEQSQDVEEDLIPALASLSPSLSARGERLRELYSNETEVSGE
jgi:hypothetical protein